jgi:hypothetical protein
MLNSRDLYVLVVFRSFTLPIAQAVKYTARLLLVQEPDKALQMYSEAQAMGPITSAIFVKIADAQAAKHHFKASASALAKAVRLQPQDVGLRLQKATMHLRMRETEAAAVELEDCTAYLEACIITCCLQIVSPCQLPYSRSQHVVVKLSQMTYLMGPTRRAMLVDRTPTNNYHSWM